MHFVADIASHKVKIHTCICTQQVLSSATSVICNITGSQRLDVLHCQVAEGTWVSWPGQAPPDMEPCSSMQEAARHLRSHSTLYRQTPLNAMPVGTVNSNAQNAAGALQPRSVQHNAVKVHLLYAMPAWSCMLKMMP